MFKNMLQMMTDYNVTYLAKHLKEIGSSEVTYTAILKTKQKYINTLDIIPLGMCALCKNLNNNNIEIGIVQSE
jgi:hypothetical protein